MDLGEFGEQHKPLLEGVDVLIAGPPCQGFSTAGKNDPDDDRNDHVLNVARIAVMTGPKVVVIENVRGLLSPKNSKHLEKTVSHLRENGYRVNSRIYNLNDYGVAQRRVRILIFAVRTSSEFELKIPSQESRTLKEVLQDVSVASGFEPKYIEKNSDEFLIAQKIAPGQKLSNVRSGPSAVHTWHIPEVFGAVTEREIEVLEAILKLRRQNRRRDFGDSDPVLFDDVCNRFGIEGSELIETLIGKKYLKRTGDHIDLRNTFNGKFRRLQWGDVSPTVDTRFGQARYFLHPSEARGFSVREAARIQSFPDSFEFSGSAAAKFRMIGNAVPPKFAELIAKTIGSSWSAL